MVKAGAESAFTQLRLLGGTATDATFSALAKQIHRTNVRHLIIDGCIVEAGSGAWSVLQAASLKTLAVDAESYAACAELRKQTPTPTAKTSDGFVHFAPVAVAQAAAASPEQPTAAMTPGKQMLEGEYITLAGTPASRNASMRDEYLILSGSPVSASRPSTPQTPQDCSYIAIGTPSQLPSSMDGEYLLICTPEPAGAAAAADGADAFEGFEVDSPNSLVVPNGTLGYVETTPQGNRFVIPTMRTATPPDDSGADVVAAVTSSADPTPGHVKRILRKAIFRNGPTLPVYDAVGLGDVGVGSVHGAGPKWRELPSPVVPKGGSAQTLPYAPESRANRRARRRMERATAAKANAPRRVAVAANTATQEKSATPMESTPAHVPETGSYPAANAVTMQTEATLSAPSPAAACTATAATAASSESAASPSSSSSASNSPARPARKRKGKGATKKASSLRSVESASTPAKGSPLVFRKQMPAKPTDTHEITSTTPLPPQQQRVAPDTPGSPFVPPPTTSRPSVFQKAQASTNSVASHSTVAAASTFFEEKAAIALPATINTATAASLNLDTPVHQPTEDAEQPCEETTALQATHAVAIAETKSKHAESAPASRTVRPTRKISKRAAAAAAAFEQAALDAAKTKASAGRKSLAGVAASSYRSRAASVFEAREIEQINAPPADEMDKPRPRAVSLSVPSAKMKDLKEVAAGVLASQHEEGNTIEEHIAEVAANTAGVTSFRIGNAQTFKRLSTAERNNKFDDIVDALSQNNVINDVTLSNCGGNDYLAAEIADMLCENSTVTTLNLDSNDIRGEGVVALADMLYSNSALTKLKLANQIKAIPTKALHKLAKAVDANTSLVVCSISCHDATARERLEKALRRNMDLVRQARAASTSTSSKDCDDVTAAALPRAQTIAASNSVGDSTWIKTAATSNATEPVSFAGSAVDTVRRKQPEKAQCAAPKRAAAAAAAAMFEQAALDSAKTKPSAGRKSLAGIAASTYRSHAASVFEQPNVALTRKAKPGMPGSALSANALIPPKDDALLATMEAERDVNDLAGEGLADVPGEPVENVPSLTLLAADAGESEDDDDALFAAAERELAESGMSAEEYFGAQNVTPEPKIVVSSMPTTDILVVRESVSTSALPAEDATRFAQNQQQQAAPAVASEAVPVIDADERVTFASDAAELEAVRSRGITDENLFAMVETPETTPAPEESADEVSETEEEGEIESNVAPLPVPAPAPEEKAARKALSPVKASTARANRTPARSAARTRAAKGAGSDTLAAANDNDAEAWRKQRRLKAQKRAEELAAKEKEIEAYRLERQRQREERKAARLAAAGGV